MGEQQFNSRSKFNVDDFKDLELNCGDCRKGFIWTAGEQAFFKSRDLKQPRRCSDCRAKKRAEMGR